VEFHPKEFLLATASNDRFVVHIVLLPVEVQWTVQSCVITWQSDKDCWYHVTLSELSIDHAMMVCFLHKDGNTELNISIQRTLCYSSSRILTMLRYIFRLGEKMMKYCYITATNFSFIFKDSKILGLRNFSACFNYRCRN